MSVQAYYEGYERALEGQQREANPYRHNDDPALRMSWDDGWEDGQQELWVSDR